MYQPESLSSSKVFINVFRMIVPDVILNPHAIPSRMTIGHLVEVLAAKAICLSPDIAKKKIDGTAFSQPITGTGAVTQLEGQPKRGLTRDGGQRFGEMERDCTISHSAAAFFHERLFTVSNAAYYQICNTCGNLVSLNPFVKQGLNQSAVYSYRLCDQKGMPSDDLITVALPKAAKILYQELISMNIRPRFKILLRNGGESLL
ncbi:unnamed protein product [Allacma fusca]|uniref:DNA-directed RNA polymerase n=1 Tax=Allacma fusca TaxID=39272 RepID=A0A8J2KWL2_9HEXA|nr:unnamed protein product [Allacma fusca]